MYDYIINVLQPNLLSVVKSLKKEKLSKAMLTFQRCQSYTKL